MIKIAHITDAHINHKLPLELGIDTTQQWELLLADIKKRKFDFVVMGGDIGVTDIYPYFFESLHKTEIPFHIVLGNHDKYEELVPFLNKDFSVNPNEYYYCFEKEHLIFFILDSSTGKISEMQQKWLINQLKITDKKPIIFIHYPILKVNSRVDIDFPLLKRNKFVKRLNKLNKEITLFCGHYHTNNCLTENNINQFITPSAAFQILQNTDTIQINSKEFGYRIIEIDEKVTSNLINFSV